MKAYTLRLPEEMDTALKHLSIEENKSIRAVLLDLISNYIKSHRETLKILSRAGWVKSIEVSDRNFKEGKIISHNKLKKMLHVED